MTENNNLNHDDQIIRVENLNQNEYIVSSSVVNVPVEKYEQKEKKITVFNLFISALSLRKSENDIFAKIAPKRSIKFLMLCTILCALIYIFFQFSDKKIVLPILLLFAAIAIPAFAILFHYEICPKKIISLFQVLIAFVFGIVLYLFIDAIVNSLLITFIYKSTIDLLIIPIFWAVGEVFFTTIFNKIFNIDNRPSGMLISVSVGMGYAFTWGMHEMLATLFVAIEGAIDGGNVFSGMAILENITASTETVVQFLTAIGIYCVYYPLIIAFWSVAIGNIISNSLSEINVKKDKPFSRYLLVILVVLLFILSVFNTSFSIFDILLKVFCLLTSLYIAISLVNNALTGCITALKENGE